MESDISQAFQEELTCFICLNCLTDPVTTSCGHSFCRACLYLSWEDIQLPVHCPTCREPSEQKDFRTNTILKKLVSIARQASLMKYLSSEEHKCVTHKETKRIFCVENRIYLCQLCSDSHEHRGHQHGPIEVAAEGQMERLLQQMASLREKIQENKGNIEAENRTTTLWTDYLTLREQMVRAEYRRLCPVRGQEEEQHIECMQNEGQRVLEKLRRREAMMVQKSQQLRGMYEELMAMSQEPHELLLQGLDDMFRRSESMQQQLSMPQTLDLELSSLPISGLTERYSHFRVNIVFEFTSICPDNVKLFNVMRRCSFRPHGEDISVDSARSYLASWGSECFISGKYYWELDLNNSSDWAVGVCKDSWLSNRNQLIESEGAFLLVCVKEGDHYSLLTTCPLFQHYIERPLGRIGVFLDCGEGCLSILNVTKSSLIYKYPPGTFNPSVRPFFSTGPT
ncbi:tripartite motif-containing protein 43-like [Peromyscus californicus insignis]|uniref:tripartite motif-containing protein 43-like n=1 Tax=Peromyscus californicus insignis TaxID=564181 RepID=UPI0022A70B5E|nr:tripartite motif-containing protein 43-like [Peromyscus californicus insignis]